MASLFQMIRYSRLVHILSQTPTWEPQRVRLLQEKRLRGLVNYARQNSKFYQKHFRHVPENDWQLTDLLPVTKEQIRENFDDVLTDHRMTRAALEEYVQSDANLGQWYLGRYAVSHTSGSQGLPLLIVQDRSCLETMFALMAARSALSSRPGIGEAFRRLLHPQRIAIVAFRRGFYPSGAALEFMQEIVGPYVWVRRLSSMQPDLIEQLNEFQPQVLVGYASVLEGLALQTDRLKLSDLIHVSNSSEQLLPRAKARIEKSFGVPVKDHYGTGECLLLADTCRHGNLHINSDWAILEVVDDDYQPVPDGQLGTRVLITNLANQVQPFIRYEVGDRVALGPAPCPCGSHMPWIKSIDGRNVELFWVFDCVQERMISGILFHAAADDLGVIREWQAVQVGPTEIHVSLELIPGVNSFEKIFEKFEEELRRGGLPANVVVKVQIVQTIAPDRKTGKIRRLINHVGRATVAAQDC